MWEHIMSAQKLRAFDIDRMNPVTKLRRAYVPIVTPLILLLFRKANDFQIALESRALAHPATQPRWNRARSPPWIGSSPA